MNNGSSRGWIGLGIVMSAALLVYDALTFTALPADEVAGRPRGSYTLLETLAGVREADSTLRSIQLHVGTGAFVIGAYLLTLALRKPPLRTVVLQRKDSSNAAVHLQSGSTGEPAEQPLFDDPSITFKLSEMIKERLTDEEAAVDLDVLPAAFAGYRRSRRTLMVMAANPSDIVVGMGGGWVYEHVAKSPLLWVKTACVDPPFDRTSLAQSLIAALVSAAEQKGFAGAYIEASVNK
jgi:hypothetical protein